MIKGSEIVIDSITLFAENRTPLEIISTEYSIMQVCNIYESIFDQYCTGSIIVNDTVGLLEKYPIMGFEWVFISYRSNNILTDNYQKLMRIYDITEMEYDQLKPQMTYKLDLVSNILINSNKMQLQCSYYNKTESEIVKIICKDNLKLKDDQLTIDNSSHKRSLTIPNMTPLEAIKYFAQSAINTNTSKLANFLFFENKNGANFVSVESLFKKESELTLRYKVNVNPLEHGFGNVTHIKINSVGKPLENRKNYMYGGTVQQVDLIEKEVTTKTYRLDDIISSQQAIDDYAEIPWKHDEYSDRSRIDTVYNHGSFKYHKTALPTRLLSMAQLENISLTCTLEGNTNIYAGMKVDFNVPSIVPGNNMSNRYLNGSWIVASVRQNISSNKKPWTVIELIKPAIKNAIEEYNE